MSSRTVWCGLGIAALAFAGCLGDDRDGDAPAASVTSELTRTFGSGALVIPLDTTSQDTGALRAYGLVYQLLSNGVAVQWAIRTGKPAGGSDFTISAPASVADLETAAAIAVPVS